MKTNVQFSCHGQQLFGKFYASQESSTPKATILLLHGFPGNEEDVLGLGEALSACGFNILTFNYRGTHLSEGKYCLANTLEDIQAAFDFLRNSAFAKAHAINPHRIVLGGWSYGGGMGLIYAANHPEVTYVFSLAGTDHGEFAREYQRNKTFAQTMDTMFQGLVYPAGPVKFAFTSIREDLLAHPAPYDFLLHCSKLAARKILLIGGLDDANVVVENHLIPGYRALKILGCESIQMNIFQDDHAFTNSRTEVAAIISAWITSALK